MLLREPACLENIVIVSACFMRIRVLLKLLSPSASVRQHVVIGHCGPLIGPLNLTLSVALTSGTWTHPRVLSFNSVCRDPIVIIRSFTIDLFNSDVVMSSLLTKSLY